jgi:multidrug efflux pump subunit AcrA (membrane-fusion protein)
MRFPTCPVAVFVVTILLLAACGKKAVEPAPLAALARPTLTLDATAGRVLVPQSALIERGGIPGVFVLTEEQQARFRMVRTGKNVNGRVEILSGLSGSETLVAGDLRDVHDGSPVKKISAADERG